MPLDVGAGQMFIIPPVYAICIYFNKCHIYSWSLSHSYPEIGACGIIPMYQEQQKIPCCHFHALES